VSKEKKIKKMDVLIPLVYSEGENTQPSWQLGDVLKCDVAAHLCLTLVPLSWVPSGSKVRECRAGEIGAERH
jgi:hypothetical protein